METNVSIIAAVIESKFKASSKTKKDITEETGLSLNTVNNALNGKNLTLNTLFKILECFTMSIEDMVDEAKALGKTFPKPTPQVVNKSEIISMIDSGSTISDAAEKAKSSEGDIIDVITSEVKKKKLPEEILDLS